MFLFLFPPKTPKPIHPKSQLTREALGSQFTYEEQTHIMALRRQFTVCPESLKLELNYQRLMFARWLIRHDLLSDELELPQRGVSDPTQWRSRTPYHALTF